MNPLVTKAHGKEKRWRAEYAALRQQHAIMVEVPGLGIRAARCARGFDQCGVGFTAMLLDFAEHEPMAGVGRVSLGGVAQMGARGLQ